MGYDRALSCGEMRMKLLQYSLFGLILAFVNIVQATDAQLEKALKKALQARLPNLEIQQINPTPIAGLYEIYSEGEIMYSDAAGNYAILGGSMYDLAGRQNLTESRTNKLLGISWQSLPLELAIETVKGNGSRKLAVFSDADCPYCKRAEKTFDQLQDVTIYTFLYPIDELHPEAGRKSKMIWCSPDRNKAWEDYMLRGIAPSASPDCDNPVAKIQELGKKFRIRATPTIILMDGKLIPGAIPKDQLESELKRVADLDKAGNLVTPTKKDSGKKQ